MQHEQQIFTIKELSEETGISGQMVRFYVQSQLLDPPVSDDDGGVFTRGHRQRLTEIQAWQAAGMTLEGIRQRFKGFRNPWFCQSTN